MIELEKEKLRLWRKKNGYASDDEIEYDTDDD